MKLAYCDYIAQQVKDYLGLDVVHKYSYVKSVGSVKMDLHPEEGYFMSTKKTIEVVDINDKKYKITVEEL